MDKLQLLRVAEVAFLTTNPKECMEFYKMIGMEGFPSKLKRINFANVGELVRICRKHAGTLGPRRRARVKLKPESSKLSALDDSSRR